MYSQGMNDIAAPILIVYIAKKLNVAVEMLDALAEDENKRKALTETVLIEVHLISPKLTLIIVSPIFWRV